MTAAGVDEQVRQAIEAELETLSRECRVDAPRLDAFLADDFHEFGASGAEIGKAGTAERVAAYTVTEHEEYVATHLRGTPVADGVVMVKYLLVVGEERSHRTSLWRWTEERGWQMFHHQGTPLGAQRSSRATDPSSGGQVASGG